jgi:hypothetical protein
MSEERTVIVHKASVNLVGGESIHDFTHKLSSKGKEYVFKKLNITKKTGWGYMVEAYGDKVVFEVTKRNPEMSGVYKYYGVPYVRKDGNFEFGELTEVEKVTSFKPVKDSMSVTKSGSTVEIKLEDVEKDFWNGAI